MCRYFLKSYQVLLVDVIPSKVSVDIVIVMQVTVFTQHCTAELSLWLPTINEHTVTPNGQLT